MNKCFILIISIAFSFATIANDYLPANIFQMDRKLTHHVIVVEKSTHRLFIYENTNGAPKLIKTFTSATGKFRGNKFSQGDHKTPEGIYFLQNFHPSDDLITKYGDYGKIYGMGAFTSNYP